MSSKPTEQPKYPQLGKWKCLMRMESETSQMRRFCYEDVVWTLRTYPIPHPFMPKLDKIHIQISRNVATTRYEFRMLWLSVDRKIYGLILEPNELIAKYTIPRWNHAEVQEASLFDLMEAGDDKEEETCKIWMDEVEGMEGMTREDNMQLLNNRIKLSMRYDDMMPGTSEEGLKYRMRRQWLDEVEESSWNVRLLEVEDVLNIVTSVELDPTILQAPMIHIKDQEKFFENFLKSKLTREQMKRLRKEMGKKVEVVKEEEVQPEIKLSAEELKKKEKKKENNKKTRESKKAKKKEEKELGRNDDDKENENKDERKNIPSNDASPLHKPA